MAVINFIRIHSSVFQPAVSCARCTEYLLVGGRGLLRSAMSLWFYGYLHRCLTIVAGKCRLCSCYIQAEKSQANSSGLPHVSLPCLSSMLPVCHSENGQVHAASHDYCPILGHPSPVSGRASHSKDVFAVMLASQALAAHQTCPRGQGQRHCSCGLPSAPHQPKIPASSKRSLGLRRLGISARLA